MPNHSHTIPGGAIGGSNGGTIAKTDTGNTPYNTSAVGGGLAHNNLQPYAISTYLVKT